METAEEKPEGRKSGGGELLFREVAAEPLLQESVTRRSSSSSRAHTEGRAGIVELGSLD